MKSQIRMRLQKPLKHGAFQVLKHHYGPRNVNPRGAERVAFFPRLGLAYNRVKKNANTTTVILLREIETGVVEERQSAKAKARRYYHLWPWQLMSLGKYHTFVVVRNPYSRVLSAFLQKFTYEAGSFRKHGDFETTPEGFTIFVRWLADGGLRRDPHWNLQTRLIMLPISMYDTVIRFENYSAEMQAMLESLGIDFPYDRLADLYPSDTGKKTSAHAKLHQYYTPETIELVRNLYRHDFEALGYPETFPA